MHAEHLASLSGYGLRLELVLLPLDPSGGPPQTDFLTWGSHRRPQQDSALHKNDIYLC